MLVTDQKLKIFDKIKNFIKMYYTRQYAIYLLRWIISAFVMMPFMIVLEMYLPLWGNLLVGQIIGSLIFFGVDKRIFGQHKKDTLENELNKKL